MNPSTFILKLIKPTASTNDSCLAKVLSPYVKFLQAQRLALSD